MRRRPANKQLDFNIVPVGGSRKQILIAHMGNTIVTNESFNVKVALAGLGDGAIDRAMLQTAGMGVAFEG